ncbi:MAG: NAD-dependent epimerase/dehydratase family protein [Terracidiphilus sp.]
METVLVTGGAGFFGRILKLKLLASGYRCVSFDLVRDETQHENLVNITGDLRDQNLVEEVFSQYRFSAVQHCGAALAHGLKIDAKNRRPRSSHTAAPNSKLRTYSRHIKAIWML